MAQPVWFHFEIVKARDFTMAAFREAVFRDGIVQTFNVRQNPQHQILAARPNHFTLPKVDQRAFSTPVPWRRPTKPGGQQLVLQKVRNSGNNESVQTTSNGPVILAQDLFPEGVVTFARIPDHFTLGSFQISSA